MGRLADIDAEMHELPKKSVVMMVGLMVDMKKS